MDYQPFFFIADLHAITVEQDPKVLRERTLRAAAQLIAMGIEGPVAALVRRSGTLLLGGAESPEVTFYAASDEDLRLGDAYSLEWQRKAGAAWGIVSPPGEYRSWVSAARGHAQVQEYAQAQAQVRAPV